MTKELIDVIVQRLGLNTSPVETRKARELPSGAEVMRVAPSPTGFMHIGTVYAAMICKNFSEYSNGVFYLRVEDTDKKREVEGALQLITEGLKFFGLQPDEGVDDSGNSFGLFGPYVQSKREALYKQWVYQFLLNGLAYPCFATSEELEELYQAQQKAKERPGYYGKWAIWREKSEEEVKLNLEQNKEFILRFKSGNISSTSITFKDRIKGNIEMPTNQNDIPLLKKNGLPTYHLAHIVDDYLMGTTTVLRGDEWLPSVPLHIDLFAAAKKAGLISTPIWKYAHISPINIMDGNSKRKLSKRKDPEAGIDYFVKLGYEPTAILNYLMTLASSAFEDWQKANPTKNAMDYKIDFQMLSKSRGALFDKQKLDNVSKNYIAAMNSGDVSNHLLDWLQKYQDQQYRILNDQRIKVSGILSLENDSNSKKARKDLAKYSDFYESYGYFFKEFYLSDFSKRQYSFKSDDSLVELSLRNYTEVLKSYQANGMPEKNTWFEELKKSAQEIGLENKVADFAEIIRVSLCGKNESPDMYLLINALGLDETINRLTQKLIR